jgi:hypothetical protein
MSNYGWTNADGEPIMDGAAYRFEQQLDAEYAQERFYDDYYAADDFDEPEDDYDEDYYANEDAAMEAGLFGWDA